MTFDPTITVGAPPGEAPQPVPMQPVVCSDVAVAGGVDDGLPVIGFQFIVAATGKPLPPILLRSADFDQLPDVAKTAVENALRAAGIEPEPTVTPSTVCRGTCGRKLFGPLLERGACFDCEPET